MAMLAIDTIGDLPIISKCTRWALTAICLHTSYVFAIVMKEISAENVIQANFSGILAHKSESVTILSDNGTKFKNKVLNEACDQLATKRLFSNPFYLQGNAKVENEHNFLKITITKFLGSSDLEWNELLPFTCYYYIIFPSTNNTKYPFFLMFGWDPAEGQLSHLTTAISIMEPMGGNSIEGTSQIMKAPCKTSKRTVSKKWTHRPTH